MRTYEEYHEILTLWELYGNKKRIARETNIARSTIRRIIDKYGSVEGLEISQPHNILIDGEPLLLIKLKTRTSETEFLRKIYAYVFGLYLGDGEISKSPTHRVYRLRIALDKKHPNLIETCSQSVDQLFSENKVGLVDSIGCVYVSLYYKYLPYIFPQHGAGKKHERDIILEDWQQHIVDQFPLEFFRGLYHSDGSRSRNVVNGKDYPRYTFSNYSADIRNLFTDTTEKLGLSWTNANARNIAISRREDVAWLDKHVGAKT